MSKQIAIIFPGQGSQSVGMLGELAASWPLVRETFAEASDTLGMDLWQVSSQGPKELLDRTDITQPAMLPAGLAVWRVWMLEVNIGHSPPDPTRPALASEYPSNLFWNAPPPL